MSDIEAFVARHFHGCTSWEVLEYRADGRVVLKVNWPKGSWKYLVQLDGAPPDSGEADTPHIVEGS